MNTKNKFITIYANLPIELRREIIAVVDKSPVTWNAAKIEIENDSEKGKIILKNLVKIGIIK
jgi:septum formation topological specificity factor MinE